MKFKLIFSLVLTVLLFHSVNAQKHYIDVLKVSVDDEIVKKYTFAFVISGKEIIPKRNDNRIIIPKKVTRAEQVGLRIKVAEHTLNFDEIFNFHNPTIDYIIRVDTIPFDSKNLHRDDTGKYKLIYYIDTVPRDDPRPNVIVEGVRFTVLVPDKN